MKNIKSLRPQEDCQKTQLKNYQGFHIDYPNNGFENLKHIDVFKNGFIIDRQCKVIVTEKFNENTRSKFSFSYLRDHRTVVLGDFSLRGGGICGSTANKEKANNVHASDKYKDPNTPINKEDDKKESIATK